MSFRIHNRERSATTRTEAESLLRGGLAVVGGVAPSYGCCGSARPRGVRMSSPTVGSGLLAMQDRDEREEKGKRAPSMLLLRAIGIPVDTLSANRNRSASSGICCFAAASASTAVVRCRHLPNVGV